MFLIKPSTISVDFFTATHATEGPTAPDMAVKFIPSWWRNLPKEIKNQSKAELLTLKKCPGFVDYFRHSIMLPMWCDLAIVLGEENTEEYSYQFADRVSSAEEHAEAQRAGHLPAQKYQHLKLINPWRAKTKHSVNWVLSQPTWCFAKPDEIIVPAGIINFAHEHSTNMNIFLPRHANESRKIFIEAGQPMAAITPMSDKKVVIKRHQVSPQEINALYKTQIFFTGDYMKKRAMRRKAENA
jgi:hypothetical protein